MSISLYTGKIYRELFDTYVAATTLFIYVILHYNISISL